jgi:hypothetical protein
VRKVEAEDAALRERRGDRGFGLRAVLENQRGGGPVQSGTEQAAEKTASRNVMPAIAFKMKPRSARVFPGIEQGIQLSKFFG